MGATYDVCVLLTTRALPAAGGREMRVVWAGGGCGKWNSKGGTCRQSDVQRHAFEYRVCVFLKRGLKKRAKG